MADAPPCLLILGMHRSGTSCLTGVLEQCGLFLGGVRRRSRYNHKGNLEVPAIWKLNDAILADAGGWWAHPPDARPVSPQRRQAIGHVTALYDKLRPSGIKDPRLLLLLDVWRSAVGPACRLVASFRHPLAVAQSLALRDNLTEETGLDLWMQYNTILVREHQTHPFPLVSFDLADGDAYVHGVRAAVDELGLSWNEAGVRQFIDATLNHHPSTDLPVPAQCRAVYDYLVANRSRAPESQTVVSARSTTRATSGAVRVPPKPAPPGRAIRARAAVERPWYRVAGRRMDWSHVQHLVMFAGNPRSGTTLVRSLLDAHPQVVLANEVHLLSRIENGEDWPVVRGRIVASARAFRRAPVWEGYRYGITPPSPRASPLVVGDKKAGATALMLLQDVFVIDRLLAWSPFPVRVVHCVRHPLDVIATKTLRNQQSLSWNIRRYFDLEQAVGYLGERLGGRALVRLHLEDLVSQPHNTWRTFLSALDLPVSDELLAACARQCFAHPSLTRQRVVWDAPLLADVAAGIAACEHLSRYTVDGVSEYVPAQA